jgi:hypothetical protein
MDTRDLTALSADELVDVLNSLGDRRDLEDEAACRLGRATENASIPANTFDRQRRGVLGLVA